MNLLALSDVDALAIAMLIILAASFGCVFLVLLTVYRRNKAEPCEVEELLQEVAAEEKASAGVKQLESSREPWEREADWWQS